MKFYEAEGYVHMEHDRGGWTCYIVDGALDFGPDTYEELLKPYVGRVVRITLELVE